MTKREQSIGCYEARFLNFHCHTNIESNRTAFSVLAYYAMPQNDCYLGASSNLEVSSDIYNGFGVSGSNIEYLFRLADFMREEVANETDDHLFEVDKIVRQKLGLCTNNVISWLELVKCRKFLHQLKRRSYHENAELVA